MIFFYGLKSFVKNIGFNIFITTQIALCFTACIFTSSALSQKIRYIRVFDDIIDGDGYYIEITNEDKSGTELFPGDISDKECFSDISPYFDEVSALYAYLTPYEDNPCETYATWSYAYRGRLIDEFYPLMQSGRWLSDIKPEDGCVHAVITEGSHSLKPGDVIEQGFTTYDGDTIILKVKITGILKEGAKLFGISPPSSGQAWEDTSFESKNIEDAFHNYYRSLYKQPVIIYNYDELATNNAAAFIKGTAMIPFKKGLTDAQKEEAFNSIVKISLRSVPFKEIKDVTADEVRKQLIILIPIIIGLVILTIISIVSFSAISTMRQLKSYGVLYICGGRWRQCSLISLVGTSECIFLAALETYVFISLLTLSGKLNETVISVSAAGIAICGILSIFILIVSLIMPLMIISKTQPREILKSEE